MKSGKKYKKKTPLENKINKNDNAPPKNPDYQDVPNSLKEFIKLKQLAAEASTESQKNKQKKKANKSVTGSKKQILNDKKQTKVSSVQKVSEKSDPDKATSLVKRKRKKINKLRMKRKLKEMEKKQLRDESEEAEMKDMVKDEIKFGEVVHRPPQISVLPRKVNKTGYENRPGRKDDLLLKSILKQQRSEHSNDSLKRKRKYLSVSDQRQIEIERQKAMLAYKSLKKRINANKG